MTTSQFLIWSWHWHPSIVIGCAVLLAAYAFAVRFRFSRLALWYVAGVLVMLFSLMGPLHELGDVYLFSAHMLQHLLLLLVVPPLLLIGIPAEPVRRALDRPWLRAIERWLAPPLVAWLLGIGTMWLWHVPAFYNATLRYESIHIFEHLAFLVTSTIFWWPVLAPVEELRLTPLISTIYLFAAMIGSSVLGIILTFAPPGLYPAYLNPADPLGILPLLRLGWGLTPPVDQQLGGLLMWVPGSLVYFVAMVVTLGRWYASPEQDADTASWEAVAPTATLGRENV